MSTQTRPQLLDRSPPHPDTPLRWCDEDMDTLYAACEKEIAEPASASEVSTNTLTLVPAPEQRAVQEQPAVSDQRAVSPPVSPAQIELDAKRLTENTGSCYLYGSLAPLFGTQFDQQTYRSYLNHLLKDAGNPADPLEKMMIEQMALSHHAIGRLHVKAASSQSEQEATIYNSAAARMMNEYRRSAMALKNYRAPTPQGHVTLMRVQQQNVSVGDQQVALVEGLKNRDAVVLGLSSQSEKSVAPALEHHGQTKSERGSEAR